MARLFHFPLDPFCRRIRLSLVEYDLSTELVEEYPWEGRQDFLAMNPAGELPVFVEDEKTIIVGVFAIGEYLEETRANPKNTLLGVAPVQRAEVRRLVSWFDQKFYNEVSAHLLFEKVVRRFLSPQEGGGAPNMGPVREALKYLESHMVYLDHLIEMRNWISGDQLTAADLSAAAHLSVIDYIDGVDWKTYPFAKSWYQRLKSRPSFRPLLADYIRGITPPASYADLDF